jgi:hypothetical protein
MIATIRQYMQKRGAKIILWLTLFALAGSTGVGLVKFSRRFNPDSIGMVNDQDITMREFKRKYFEVQNAVQEIRRLYGPQADMVLKMWGLESKPDEMVLEGLISEKVMQSAASNLGIQIDAQFVREKLHDPIFVREYLGNEIPPQAIAGGTLDVAALKAHLERQGISEEEFEEKVHDTMQRILFTQLFDGTLYTPQSQIKEAYSKFYLKKKLGLLSIPFERYVTKARAEKISDSDLEKYYSAHKEEYRVPEKRSATQWAFDAENYGIEIPEKDLESEYHKRKRGFIEKPEVLDIQHILLTFTDKNKIEVRGKAQELLKAVKANPESFAKIAEQNSQSKDKGATVGIKRGEKSPLFEQAVSALGANEISAVMETPEGFEIIKLIAKKEPVFKPFEKVKDTLKKSIKQEKFNTLFSADARRVLSQASELPDIFKNFTADRKGQQSKVENKTLDETIHGEKLFGLAKVGDRVFYLEGGKGYIVELTGIVPSEIPVLTKVKDAVEKDIYRSKAHSLLEADLQAAKVKLTEGKESLEALSKALNGSVETTDFIDASNTAAITKLRDKKLPVNEIMALHTKGSALYTITPNAGYLVEVKEIEPFDESKFKEMKIQIGRQLRQQELNGVLNTFTQALREKAHVDINKDFKQRIRG